jgi:hypothetical protein
MMNMNTTTRAPRLLVKLPAAPAQAAFTFNSRSLSVSFEPLFRSIRPNAKSLDVAGQPQWHIMAALLAAAETNSWDLCHHIVTQGFGVAGLPNAQFAEPDLDQQWISGTAIQHALAASQPCDRSAPPDARLPVGPGFCWFRSAEFSQLEAARTAVGKPNDRVRIAHFDTGYDPNHETKPINLRTDLQQNFVDNNSPDDATDHTNGIFTNLGHGTGTLSLLAGADIDGAPLGGASFLDVIPVRVANSVVLFRNSAIAKALDYVHGLFGDESTRAHVITMSMGGLASQVWCDAVNALYELGVFIVTAAGNNFGNLPTRNIVYPGRFRRVVAACGVMADGNPYADLPINIMAGNYGPASKMATAMAAFTPNTPWARLGCGLIVDHNGRGTSAATPQIAAAAALWVQKFKKEWEQYREGWMRVEAVRKALFESAQPSTNESRNKLGRGMLKANEALTQRPVAAADLQMQPVDTVSFPFLRVITGLGVAAVPNTRHSMLELESLQLTQQFQELERLLPDPEDAGCFSEADRQRILRALHDAPGASGTLRAELEKHRVRIVHVQPATAPAVPVEDAHRLKLALDPALSPPAIRRLRVFAFDPLLAYKPDLLQINETCLEIRWEDLKPGPVGEYLEVVDVDPSTGSCYAPVDLNHPTILAQGGLSPSESDPRFHQQMVYGVAMKTLEYFERALGRVALWAPRFVKYMQNGKPEIEEHYVRRLRIYPHALREANSFYSPVKKALLLGYFPASETDPGDNLPGGNIFCAVSHDIIAHETTHALLDGLHRYFGEPSNPDLLAFHEAFADIVALFQHFTVPEALRDQIARTRGDLSKQNMLGELAGQFGQGIGQYGALRSAIGRFVTKEGSDEKVWVSAKVTKHDYTNATDAHNRGAVLVAAVFDAFLDIYRRRSADLIRLGTAGTGILPEGQIPHDLVNRLAQEASKTASHVLNICIRALDYCPPVDLNFGEYVRALITADYDLVPTDPWAYRPAFIQGFRRRGIYPENVRNMSAESLRWERPEVRFNLEGILKKLQLNWDLHVDRRRAFEVSKSNGYLVHTWLREDPSIKDADTVALGFYRAENMPLHIAGQKGQLRNFEVHSVRPVRRIGPDGQQETDLVMEITQSWIPEGGGGKFRGGCTLIINLETRTIRYVIRKRVDHEGRFQQQEAFQTQMAQQSLSFNYVGNEAMKREPFAIMHRGM